MKTTISLSSPLENCVPTSKEVVIIIEGDTLLVDLQALATFNTTLEGHLVALLSSISEEDFVPYLWEKPSTFVAYYLEDYFLPLQRRTIMIHYSIF